MNKFQQTEEFINVKLMTNEDQLYIIVEGNFQTYKSNKTGILLF